MTTRQPPIDPAAGLLDGDEAVQEVSLDRHAADPGNYPRGTFRKVVSGMITVIALIAASYLVPALEFARPWTPSDPVPFWNLVGRELLGEGAAADAADEQLRELTKLALEDDPPEPPELDPTADAPLPPEPEIRAPAAEHEPIPPYQPHLDDKQRVERRLDDPAALDPFYAALTRTELRLPGAITRAIHYGDSAIGNDGITGSIRQRLQARFGDAGHGYHLLGQPNASYRHQGVTFVERAAFNLCFIIQGCRGDGRYGLGGTTFESTGGAEIRLGTATKGVQGRRVARFEIWYAALSASGTLRARVDDLPPVDIATAGPDLEDRWEVIQVPDGEHTLTLRAAGGGKVRAYGVVLERDAPGVVWDELSQIGALTRRLLNFDPGHIHRQIARRSPDLLVLMFGGNDMNTKGTMSKYKSELTDVIRLLRGGKDPLPCLVMAPLDHGERDGQAIITRPIVPRLVDAQREVAAAEGCAFFDTYQAMGGEGSMGRWARAEPRLGSGDLAHLTHHGHKVVGGMLYRALMAGYRDFRRRVAGHPMSVLEDIMLKGGQHTPAAPLLGAEAGAPTPAAGAEAPAPDPEDPTSGSSGE
ncbi:MAG: hypothetical protein IPK80_16875 [Nannocystis sp.]|nr:hypothetical protein [Nannocystis sp.]